MMTPFGNKILAGCGMVLAAILGMMIQSCREAEASVKLPPPAAASVWIPGHPVQMLPATGTNTSLLAWMQQTEFGLRNDGVVVWRVKQ